MEKNLIILGLFLVIGINAQTPLTYQGVNADRIRGVNCYVNIDENDIDSLKSLGANTVRIMLMIHDLFDLSNYDTCPEGIDDDKLDKILDIVDMCEEKGVTAIIDIHETPGLVRWSGWKDFRLWQDNRLGEKLRKLLVETWKELAEELVNYPAQTVIFELLNEPEPKENDWDAKESRDWGNAWNKLQTNLIKEVRIIDTVHTIICSAPFNWRVSSISDWSPSKLSSQDNKIMAAVHMYAPFDYTMQWDAWYGKGQYATYPGLFSENGLGYQNSKKIFWDKKQLLKHLQPVADFQKKFPTIPVVVTEFSVLRTAPGANQYLKDLIEVFKELGVGWTYHVYKEREYMDQFNDCSDTMFELKDIPASGRKQINDNRLQTIIKGFKN